MPFILPAQEENALPPGPGRIFGTVTDTAGNPLSGIEIQVVYSDGKFREADIFRSTANGTFTCYVFRYDQHQVTLVFRQNGRRCASATINGIFEGSNYGRDADRYICKPEKYRGLKRLYKR